MAFCDGERGRQGAPPCGINSATKFREAETGVWRIEVKIQQNRKGELITIRQRNYTRFRLTISSRLPIVIGFGR